MAMRNPFSGFNVSDDWAAHRARGSLGGVDFSTPPGTPIVAPNPGFVSYEYGNGSGGYIISLALSNSPGYVMQFLHCSGFVGGDRNVVEGELLGYTGGVKGAAGSGSSTGPHVHVHLVDPNGVREDVMPWFGNSTTGGLVVDGGFGPATIRKLQAALGVAADGDFGPASTRALQELVGATVDGSWGPATTRALQGFLGVPADGSFGPQTVRALQESLNGGTFVKPTPAPAAPVIVPPAPPVTPPAPVTDPPAPIPSPIPAPSIKEPNMTPADKAEQQKQIDALPAQDLGVIIQKPGHRKLAYALYSLASLLVTNAAVAYAALGASFPPALTVAIAVIGNLAVPFSALAIANAKK